MTPQTTETGLDYRTYWEDGYEFEDYLENEVEEHPDLWRGVYRKHETPTWAVDEVSGKGGPWRLLVLAEDWCGDASNTVPILARFAEAAPNVEMRVVKRDENPDLMDAYLTNGGRSIPVAVVLDEEFEPVGSWGPRPAELQEFVLGEKEKDERPMDEIYREARRWYARDGGETTLRELLDVLNEAG
ncbi:MAG TPA: thioredoxin family protein [Gemmatimonadota bacterium]|nr:thioredoxin family protein [Gemmatimonadota bacterium]